MRPLNSSSSNNNNNNNNNKSIGRQSCANGGQRVGTLLIYLNDVSVGGSTAFVNLELRCQPKQGKAIVFFPCFGDGMMDSRMLHAAEPAEDTKWVSQIWIRQAPFVGTTGRPDSSSDEDDDDDDDDDEDDEDGEEEQQPQEQGGGGGGGAAATTAAVADGAGGGEDDGR